MSDFLVVFFCLILPIILFIFLIGLSIFLGNKYYKTNKDKADLQSRIKIMEENANLDSRNQWFKKITKNEYRNEIEVEVKFVYFFVKYLGYKNRDIQIRVPINMRAGRQELKVVADWVIFNNASKPVFIIEAKEPSQIINDAVIQQARSYAIGLNVPFYVITNGKNLLIYKRGIEQDICIINCDVISLSSVWENIEKILGNI